jgi:hypothetical protein
LDDPSAIKEPTEGEADAATHSVVVGFDILLRKWLPSSASLLTKPDNDSSKVLCLGIAKGIPKVLGCIYVLRFNGALDATVYHNERHKFLLFGIVYVLYADYNIFRF